MVYIFFNILSYPIPFYLSQFNNVRPVKPTSERPIAKPTREPPRHLSRQTSRHQPYSKTSRRPTRQQVIFLIYYFIMVYIFFNILSYPILFYLSQFNNVRPVKPTRERPIAKPTREPLRQISRQPSSQASRRLPKQVIVINRLK